MFNEVVIIGHVVSYDEVENDILAQVLLKRKNDETDIVPVLIIGSNSSIFKEYCDDTVIIGVRGILKSNGKGEVYVLGKQYTILSKEEQNDGQV